MKNTNKIVLLTGLLFLLTQTSCLKKQNLEDNKLGPIINPDVVEEKMAEGIGMLDPDDIKKNESSNVMAMSTYEDAQTIKIFNQSLIVSSIVSDATKTRINLDYSKTDYLNSNQSFNNFVYPLDFTHSNDIEAANITQRSQLTAKNADKVPFFLYRAFIVMAVFACREDKVTCHNLVVQDQEMDLSPELADPRICADTLRCKIPVRKVEFDLIDNKEMQSDGQPLRSHYKFLISRSLPFFSKVLQYCVRGLVDMQDRKVLAEDCVSVNSFAVGD